MHCSTKGGGNQPAITQAKLTQLILMQDITGLPVSPCLAMFPSPPEAEYFRLFKMLAQVSTDLAMAVWQYPLFAGMQFCAAAALLVRMSPD